MKLKNLIYGVSLSVAALAFVACDNVEEGDRFIYVEPAEVAKRVLLEDFTGQRCVNCPAAAELIETLQEEYGADNVIAVGIYGGDLGAEYQGKKLPLYTDEGQWYYDHWGVTTQPAAMIDRRGGLLDTPSWPGAVYNSIQQKPSVMLEAECAYDEVSRNVDIKVAVDGLDDVNGYLQVWLVEDSVVSLQFLSGVTQPDLEYVHNHVFRATVNGQTGDAISIATGDKAEREFKYNISSEWKPENMSVVTFVYDDSGVLQAAKAKVIPVSGDEETPGEGEIPGGGTETGE